MVNEVKNLVQRIKFEFIHEIFFNLLRVHGTFAAMSINFHFLINKNVHFAFVCFPLDSQEQQTRKRKREREILLKIFS